MHPNYPNSNRLKNLNVETSRPVHPNSTPDITAVPRLGDLGKTPQNLVRLATAFAAPEQLVPKFRAKAMDFILWSPPNICKTRDHEESERKSRLESPHV